MDYGFCKSFSSKYLLLMTNFELIRIEDSRIIEEEEEKSILVQEGFISPPKKVNMCGSAAFCSSSNQRRPCTVTIRLWVVE